MKKNKVKNILVTGTSGIIGYGILRSLRVDLGQYIIIGTSIYDNSIAPAFCNFFEKAIPTNHPDYMDWLFEIIMKYSVDMVIPGIEVDMIKWNKEREMLLSTGVFPLLNNDKLIELCSDKWAFYEHLILDNAKYAIPTTLNGSFSTFKSPFLLKPRCGSASKGIIKISNEEDFDMHKHKIGPDLMMQPIIGSVDEEYTVAAFFDYSSKLIDCISLKRKLSNEGYTQEAKVVDTDFSAAINDLAEAFKPIGPTNFQFRLDGGSIKLLEINPRISASTSIRAALGYNESIMSVNYFLENQIPTKIDISNIKNKRAIRYIEDYIF
jgi:carbamoyl-phosphate synthase large subunit